MLRQLLPSVTALVCLLSVASGKKHQPERRAEESFKFLNNASSKYLVEKLPDINYEIGELYSGTVPVNESDPSRSLFFVFQPTINEPVDEITIWFNGGPGCSSLEGFLQENGRFIWSWGMYSALENPYSWVNLTNVLWVEYPVGVGFSQGEVTATTQEETAQDFLAFFKNFQKIFGISQYKIYVTGESYAGRYVPYVSAAMVDAQDKEHYDLKGALMYDPIIGEYYWQHCAMPIVPFVQAHANFYNFNESFMSYLETAHEYCGYANYSDYFLTYPPPGPQPVLNAAVNNISLPLNTGITKNISGPGVPDCDLWEMVSKEAYRTNPCFSVDMISQTCPIPYDPLGEPTELGFVWPGSGAIYFNRTDVKKAMHAPMNVSWNGICGSHPFKGNGGPYSVGDTSLDSIQHVLPKVIEATNRVLIANGDYDQEILTQGTMLAIQNMTWNGKLGFQEKPSTPIDIKIPDLLYGQTFRKSKLIDSNGDGYDGPGGQGIMGIQHYERGLLWAETYQCGHMEPQFQPRSAYRHLQWLLGKIDEL